MSLKNTADVKVYRVGVIGAGSVSSCHILALQRLSYVQIIGITDLDQARAEQAASNFKIPWYKSAQEMYAAKPDVVHVLTPPSSHCAVALQALEKGCHVFVEKPMATNEEECELMIRQADAAQRTLSVDHSAKFDPTVQKALRIVRSGAIGDVLSVDYFRSSEYPPYSGGPLPQHYQDGGFPFRDIGVHALYLMETFLGQIQNLETTHRGTAHHPSLVFDEWSALAHCDNGLGHFHLSWTSRPIQHVLSIHGTRGNILLDLYLGTCVTHKSLPIPKPAEAIANSLATALRSVSQVCWNTLGVATGRFLRGADIHSSIREFYSALSRGISPPVLATEGKRMVKWLETPAREADAHKRQFASAQGERKTAVVLVTGATGFLGHTLVNALLSSGKQVRLLVHRRPVGEIGNHPAVDIVTGDLGDPTAVDRAVQGAEVVYHVGAATSGSGSDHECGTIWGTKNIVDSCLRHRATKLVYVSSLGILNYAALSAHARLDESAVLEAFPEKRGHYANAKLQAEKIVLEAMRNDGLQAVIFRPGSIFGPGAEKVPPYGIVPVGNRWIVMGSGNISLPLVYVDDVVDALLKAAACDKATGQIFHLVDPHQIVQREYLEYALMKMPGTRVYHIPLAILYCAAAAMQCLGALVRRNVPLTLYRLRSIKPHVEFDCSAARDARGWIPRIGTLRGLEITFGKLPIALGQRGSLLEVTRQQSEN